MIRDARIDGPYRYWLHRLWRRELGCCGFILLNPSKADAKIDDPTLRRCIGFAKRWGFGAITVVNLFALRATNPCQLWEVDDPVGPKTNHYLLREVMGCDRLVVGWGARGRLHNRDKQVLRLLKGYELWCFGENKDGTPVHPLYQPWARKLVIYN